MSLEKLNLNKGLSRKELRRLFQARIKEVVSPKINISSYALQQLENIVGGVEAVGGLLQRSVDYLKEHQQSRRTFLKTSAGLTAIGLTEFVYSCAPALKEIRQQVIDQKWDSNPIIPIPKNSCYVGGHRIGSDAGTAELYGMNIGKIPAFWDFSIGKYAATNAAFQREWCEILINIGIIPEVNYGIIPFKNFKEIAKGKHDETITKFAESAAKCDKPYVFIPFKEPNITAGIYWIYGGGSAKWFKETWRHMHDIFEKTGANKNTIWAINYLGTYSPAARKSLENFYPGDDVVDWIGFTVQNRTGLGHMPSRFRWLFQSDYNWARRNHYTKPLALFEVGRSNGYGQAKWIKRTYRDIKEKFPAIKMAQWWDGVLHCCGGLTDDQRFSSSLESIEAMEEVHKDPYFIGAPLPFLKKYMKKM